MQRSNAPSRKRVAAEQPIEISDDEDDGNDTEIISDENSSGYDESFPFEPDDCFAHQMTHDEFCNLGK